MPTATVTAAAVTIAAVAAVTIAAAAAVTMTAAAEATVTAAAVTVATAVALHRRSNYSNPLTAVIADGTAGAAIASAIDASSAFVTSAKPTYQLWPILGFTRIVLLMLLERYLPSHFSVFYSFFTLVTEPFALPNSLRPLAEARSLRGGSEASPSYSAPRA